MENCFAKKYEKIDDCRYCKVTNSCYIETERLKREKANKYKLRKLEEKNKWKKKIKSMKTK